MELFYCLGERSGNMIIKDIVETSGYPKILFDVDGKEHLISQNNINNYMTNLFGYIYEVGDVVNSVEILSIDNKDLTVKCTKDGYIYHSTVNDLRKGTGCPACNKRVIVKGINDFATTHKELVKYLKDEEDAYTNFYGSAKKVNVKCPICGYEKQITFNMLTEKGFSCPNCSDGISFGEKYVVALLNQTGLKFSTQKIFEWSETRRYDFYIDDLDCIIEVHGLQHYHEVMGNWKVTLSEQEEIDSHKEHIAKENGVTYYIIIDARRSDGTYIMDSILNSQLSKLIDLSNINWTKCLKNTMTSAIYQCCDLWNGGLDVKGIAKVMKLSDSGVRKYLKQGTALGVADYRPVQGEHLHK